MFISSDFLLFFFGFFPGTNITLSCLCCHYRLAFLLCGCQCKGRRTGETYFFLGAPINRMFLVRPHLASFATALVREDNEFDIVAWLIIFLSRFLGKHVKSTKHFLDKGKFLHVWRWKTYNGKDTIFS